MQPDLLIDFDATTYQAAKPIYSVGDAVPIADCDAPESLKELANLNGFMARAGLVLANGEGVLLGIGDGSDPFVTAAACQALPAGDYRLAEPMDGEITTKALLGWLMGTYKFSKYKSNSRATARLIAPENTDVDTAKRMAMATGLVRDLINTPAGDMMPDDLEAAARQLAETAKADIDVIVGDDLLTAGFPMIHAVGRASTTPPRLIDITWGNANAPKVTLVGKGVCFDSGGLNIKGSTGMSLMKKDMGGAANVLGLGQMIMAAGLNVRLRILIPAVENAIAGNAFRPGDVLQSRKGITVEIGNTDAEGRLVLGDALDLACEEDPSLLISMATLTGAARVAVGPELVPFYTDDEAFATSLSQSAVDEFDPVWRLPLWKGYTHMLSSQIADINNISGGSFAGSITAALFLEKFVAANTRWAHFDIYGWRPKSAPGRPLGGEAQAIRALYRAIESDIG